MMRLSGVVLLLLFSFTSANAQPGLEKIREVKGKLIRDIKSLKDHKRDPAFKDIPVRDWNGVIWGTRNRPQKPDVPESGVDQSETARQNIYNNKGAGEEPQQNAGFGGVGATTVAPADPTMAVGPNHVMQAVNATSGTYFQIWNKSGTLLLGPKYLDEVTTLGGLGDPVFLYDQLANRFVMTEFANSGETNGVEGLIMAVSKTGDPTGGWWVYFYPSIDNAFPDYPKFSVWPDGYYATSNDFASSYIGSSIYAFDRASMLNGAQAADLRTFRFRTTSYTRYFTMCPVLLQGTTLPPSGTGGLFAYMNDNFGGSVSDSVGIIELKINWSVQGDGAYRTWSSLPVASFNGGATCMFSRGACIPQPGTSKRLESLERRVMNQPIYRNFGTHQGIVMTHFANVSSVAAMRWYELRNTATDNSWNNGSSTWTVNQQSSYAPGDGVHRWMGSIAYNAAGDIALAYNVSSSSVYPGLRYTGRKATDPPNQMTSAETVLKAGSASATGYSRYGDYNHLVADPNGTDFWFTAMYNVANPWSTWVSSFTVGGTTPPPPPPGCTDTYETNETSSTAKTISANTTITAGITTATDLDWFTFKTNNTATNVKVTLSNLPADYNVTLHDNAGIQIASNIQSGTATETIVFNSTSKRATYRVKIAGVAGAFNSSTCYNLLVQTSASQFAPVSIGTTAPTAMEMTMMKGLKLFPNPVMNELQVQYEAPEQGDVTVTVTDITGRLRMRETFTSRAGGNLYRLNTSRMNNGMYIMQIMQNGSQVAKKFEVRK
jgi:Secretion system C-terminal sorting domain